MTINNRPTKMVLGSLVVLAGVCPAKAEQKPLRISYVLALTAGEWNTEIKAGAKAAAKDLGFPIDLRFSGPSSFDPPKQATIFQDQIQTSPDAIVVTNVAAPLFIEPGLEAKKDGVTVSWMNSSPSSEFYDSFFVSSDPTASGRTVADVIAKTLEDKLQKPASEIEGNILVGVCVPGLSVLENRVEGTRRGISELLPKVTVLPTVPTKPDREGSFATWNQAIRKNPKALAYLDTCEAGQQNIAKIIADDKLTAVSVAYDLPEDVREAIKAKVITAAVPASFYVQAYMSVYATATALHSGKPLPGGWLKVSPLTIDETNVGAFSEAWREPVAGLRAFFDGEIKRAIAALAKGELTPMGEYDHPPK